MSPPIMVPNELFYITEYIRFRVLPLRQDYESYRHLYIDQNMSANSIALELGVSKQAVLSRLRKFGLVEAKRPAGFHKNGKSYSPPFGYYRLEDGALIQFKPEMLILRKICFERDVRKQTFREIANTLEKEGFQTRSGNRHWQHSYVVTLYRYWKEKLKKDQATKEGGCVDP